MPTMSRSQTITDPDWLHNSHAGELLWSEFMEPLGLSADALGGAIGVDPDRLDNVIGGSVPMDADLDLRLGR
jgi:antitoxin HigA-1